MKISDYIEKEYRCENCGNENVVSTNHWHERNARCEKCREVTSHQCLSKKKK